MPVTTQKKVFDFSEKSLYNPAYTPLFNNKSEFLHLYGSAGSGKSRFQAQRTIIKSFLSHRRGRKSLCIRKVFNTLKESVYSELKTVIYQWKLEAHFEMLKSPLSITNKVTGIPILFIGLDDVEKVKSISGVDDIWIEEATELESMNEIAQLRLRMRGFDEVQMALTYNPIDEYHFINTEIHQKRPPGHDIHKFTYADNIKMLAADPNYAPYMESLKESNPNYYQVYVLGNWGRVLEGLIYEQYLTGGAFPQKDGADDIQFYGLDFGFTNQTALVAMHVQDALPKKRLFCKQVIYQSGMNTTAMVEAFDNAKVRKDVKIIADAAQPGLILDLKQAGYRVSPCEKGPGSVLIGINRIRKYSIEIDAGSKDIVKEISNYQKRNHNGQWLEEPELHQVDHALDAIRYGEQTQGKKSAQFHSF